MVDVDELFESLEDGEWEEHWIPTLRSKIFPFLQPNAESPPDIPFTLIIVDTSQPTARRVRTCIMMRKEKSSPSFFMSAYAFLNGIGSYTPKSRRALQQAIQLWDDTALNSGVYPGETYDDRCGYIAQAFEDLTLELQQPRITSDEHQFLYFMAYQTLAGPGAQYETHSSHSTPIYHTEYPTLSFIASLWSESGSLDDVRRVASENHDNEAIELLNYID